MEIFPFRSVTSIRCLGSSGRNRPALNLTNIIPYFDLIRSKGFKVILVLTNTHWDEGGSSNNQIWYAAILNTIKSHPALDLVVFNGTPLKVDTNGDGIVDSCGIPAEPPLWGGTDQDSGDLL